MNSSLSTDPLTPSIDAIASALQQGRSTESETLARAYLAKYPGDENGLFLLAMSLGQQGLSSDALNIYRTLTELFPHSAVHWTNLGTTLRQADEHDAAESAYRKALKADSQSYEAQLNLGYLFLDTGNYLEAREHLLRAHALNPNSAEARIYAAHACLTLDDRNSGERLLAPRHRWHELSDELVLELAILTMGLRDPAEGVDLLEKVLQRDPHNVRAAAILVEFYERNNRLDEARALLAKLPSPESIEDPKLRHDVIDANVSFAMRENNSETARSSLEQLMSIENAQRAKMAPWGTARLRFALAKIYDKQGATDLAMSALHQAHERQLLLAERTVPKLLQPDSQPLMTATQWVSAESFAMWPVYPAPSTLESPIFIVGFPRSGTTMLEQMLDAHPLLKSMDERTFLQDLLESMSEFGYLYPDELGKLTAAQCDEMRKIYWDQVANVAPRAAGQRLVDKNPLNMLRLPLIYRLFPNASIILALRHPCDVILSNYMQNFSAKPFIVLCSTLERLARGYVTAFRFWLHHVDLFKPNVIVSRYEDLLDDFPNNVKIIGDFLELEDASPMTKFDHHARSKGFISTPSYTQVIEPPNKNAVGRWRRYERYFEPVLPILQPMLRRFGYDT